MGGAAETVHYLNRVLSIAAEEAETLHEQNFIVTQLFKFIKTEIMWRIKRSAIT